VKVLRREGRISYMNLSTLEPGNRANSPKQAFPSTQNGAAEAEDGEYAAVSLGRWRGTDQQIWSDDSSSPLFSPRLLEVVVVWTVPSRRASSLSAGGSHRHARAWKRPAGALPRPASW
jgi:hypothetical protein